MLFCNYGFANSGNPIKENYHYTQFNINDGLPSSEIYEIFQDSKGYLWIGTDKGVSKFNGTDFENFTTKDGLTDNTVFLIKEDLKGRIWFLGLNRNICFYENGEFHTFKYNDQIIQAFHTLQQGYAYSKFEVTENDEVIIGVSFYKTVKIDALGNIIPLQSNIIKSIHDKAVRTSGLQNYVSKLNYQEVKYISKYPVRLFSYNDVEKVFYIDSLLFFSSKKGVKICDWRNPDLYWEYLTDFKVTAVCKDFEGGLWFATQYNGLIHVPNTNIKKFELNGSEKKEYFHGIVIQNNRPIFIYGTNRKNQGVLFKIRKDPSSLFSLSEELSVFDIPEKHLLRGIKFESNSTFKEFSHGVHAILKVNDTIYITAGSSNIITIYKRNDFSLTPVYKTTSIPRTLDLLSQGPNVILIGTTNGLYQLNLKKLLFTKVHKSLPFSNLRIQDLDKTNEGEVIVATRGNGLFIWSELDVRRFGENSGLKTDIINQIYYHDASNEIYVASNKGVSKLLGSYLVVNMIDKNHGVESTDIRQFLVHNDTLYFANNKVISYLPISSSNVMYPKPFLYENFCYMNDSIPLSAHLKHYENDLHVSYTGISFRSKGLTYSYRITPLQKEWHTTKDKSLVFENLEPKKYSMEIRAINSVGLFSNSIIYNFTITPPFYKQLWFKILIATIILTLIYISTNEAIVYYKKQLQTQKNIKQLQSLSLQAKMNPHFIFNSLNSIQNFILKNEKEEASEYLLDFAQLARLTITNSDSTAVTLNNELKTLRLYTALERKRIRRNYEFIEKIDAEVDLKACVIPSLLLQPYIENAIWHGRIHTKPNGFIELKIELVNDMLFFEIIDNGIGVNASKKLKSKLNVANNEEVVINADRIALIRELHKNLSSVEVENAFYNEEQQEWYGTKVSFSFPYELNKQKNQSNGKS